MLVMQCSHAVCSMYAMCMFATWPTNVDTCLCGNVVCMCFYDNACWHELSAGSLRRHHDYSMLIIHESCLKTSFGFLFAYINYYADAYAHS
jgi:hypothetical protein